MTETSRAYTSIPAVFSPLRSQYPVAASIQFILLVGVITSGVPAMFKGPLRTLAKGGRHYHFQARPRRSYYDSPNRLNFRVRMGSGALLLVWSRSLV